MPGENYHSAVLPMGSRRLPRMPLQKVQQESVLSPESSIDFRVRSDEFKVPQCFVN